MSNPDANTSPDPDVIDLATTIFGLARTGDTPALAAYLTAGVPANLTNDSGDSLVMLAAYHGHADTVALLCAHGADVNRLNDRGQSPLAGAVFKGADTVVETLMANGADPTTGHPSAADAARMFNKEHYLRLFDHDH